MEEAKKERPQNKNLRPIGTDRSTPERDAAIHKKSGPAAARAHRRNVALTELVRIVAFLGTQEGKVLKPESLKNIKDVTEQNIPQIVLIIQAQFEKAKMGDIEARDWICKWMGVSPENLTLFPNETLCNDPNNESPGGFKNYHFIRGQKPIDPDAAEREDREAQESKRAIDEAMAALEQSEKEGGSNE